MPRQHLTLNASHLGASRDDRLLFKPISFNLQSGQALLIEGPNGIGKTTLLRVLAGLLAPACGDITCNMPLQSQLAYLGPHHGIKGLLTPLEYLHYYANPNCTKDCRAKNAEGFAILEQLNLAQFAHKPCASLSSGQKQRVALARVLTSQQSVWILDEPLTALDLQGEQLFVSLLQNHLTQGGVAIIASHQNIRADNLQKISLEA